MRIGIGKDIHKLEEGEYLTLGGIKIPSKLKSVSYSDGDVLIHALIDSIFGALGLGDIGETFKDSDPLNKGKSSIEFLKETVLILKRENKKIVNIDTIITLEEPKLKENKLKIRKNLTNLLDINENQINIKAGTNEGFDSLGRKESIEAIAITLLEDL